jgi:hypothetical protein
MINFKAVFFSLLKVIAILLNLAFFCFIGISKFMLFFLGGNEKNENDDLSLRHKNYPNTKFKVDRFGID